ncbi:Piso0_001859 [Millerozyma farinosa CBS 7064]|uniref:Piso0_001859 protein n=1 Tax=Pichia sorbitophila (strain ATCC MYA-4447 / BCRC 22081 / CBS 7064 / NBRC 10061 / NRRL Y-12695) TaxID=559304 RepID=G8YLX7_PICSO|nr:Piso0_001859 [Millerozyma farinosa CBS 7064]
MSNLSKNVPSLLKTSRPSDVFGRRSLSDTLTFRAIDRFNSPIGKGNESKINLLKVPLLKSPSHLGHYSSRVNRPYNEDAYSASVLALPGARTVFNFSIFDGHGGDECSNFLKDNLASEVEQSSALIEPGSDKLREYLIKKYWKAFGGYWKWWYKRRKENIKMIMSGPGNLKLQNIKDQNDDLRRRIPFAFLEADYKFLENTEAKSGSTCTSAFIETVYSTRDSPPGENYYFNRDTISKLTIAHVGDTKAILVDREGEAHALTEAHHPSNPIEAKRLRKYSAKFFMADSFGEERFISVANTRAFGDQNYKGVGVTAEPDIVQLLIGDRNTMHKTLTKDEIHNSTIGSLGGDESFLILCTDGVTDVLTDQEIADIVMSTYNMKGNPVASAQRCAEEVIKFVEYIGGSDNATCLVVRLIGWGKWPIIDRTGALRQERMDDYNPRSRR